VFADQVIRSRVGREGDSVSEAVAVGSVSALKTGEMRAFELNGLTIAIAHVGGSYFAFGNVCTHQQCPLVKGELEGTTVTCSCHGSQFDVTSGAVLRGPAQEPVESYQVLVEGDSLQVEV
jgi:3-phenylpropionate/trans-cinnamate dioxygenase ferredoxin subunit